ncbi:4-hydroxy-3-methylbut-2-enyl diphosphate reductase [[Actinomadura] parvosata subsp. kistnae]|uniref:4-hydroxy-3-methylbut-2-enyl diphosphate reductase n=1 Tax=[Actinomadura] parvosata subsp. kistnae TaxID=1909395 RepID=A0A1V0AD46_9ACTN|nr:4-hydroxy-3-methylbut-2-enyl diphosphate reductase [Nonomuraea sp. ATCC 55076]AQZ68089.1 4-hydroxy-3-methylbut-2-enyl diphosphate reductase [Nonomuraea sp. ATCC 55076]SPL93531.1 4-hydroxy-3-methylbut-2-enyl diphosphate reductase [Actinomadura parvosata subsp. kistnae]
MAQVLLAAPRGYCAGVERAIVTVEEALKRFGSPVYVRKQIVHNTFVVDDLSRRGAIFVDELDEVPDGALVVFSAHGVSPAVKQEAARRGLRTIDATCPLVTKVHKEAVRMAEAGYEIVLIGHAEHEEVEGTVGEAPGRIHVVDPAKPGEFRADGPVSWLSQTTLAVDETLRAVERLRERHPGLVDPPSDDICYASQNRQEAVRAIAPRCELVIVVGSANSSNSQRLVDVALAAGAGAAYLVDRAAHADERWLDGVQTVGVSSGASVPEGLVTELLDWLAAHGYADVEPVTLTEETLTFSLPLELRSNRKPG